MCSRPSVLPLSKRVRAGARRIARVSVSDTPWADTKLNGKTVTLPASALRNLAELGAQDSRAGNIAETTRSLKVGASP